MATVSTHSRPKAAGSTIQPLVPRLKSFNTQPPEGGWQAAATGVAIGSEFQHTAARRRLDPWAENDVVGMLFQHTAARRRLVNRLNAATVVTSFQHTAARRRLDSRAKKLKNKSMFQHTAARRRLESSGFFV